MNKKNFYDVLGVPQSSTKKEISDAYRKLVMKYHPDKFKDDKERKLAEEKITKINEAFDVLGNDSRRQEYDSHLRNGTHYSGDGYSNYHNNPADGDSFFQQFNFGFGDFHNIFKQFFDVESEDFAGSNGHNAPGRKLEISLTFEEWFNGVTKDIKIKRKVECLSCKKQVFKCEICKGQGYTPSYFSQVACMSCGGKGKINKRISCIVCKDGSRDETSSLKVSIPPFTLKKLILSGYGDYYSKINKYSNIELDLSIAKHEFYYFADNSGNINLDLHIGIEEFLSGTKISFKYMDGQIITIEIPPLTIDKIVVGRKGVKSGASRGDLIINIKVSNNLSDKLTREDLIKRINIKPLVSNIFNRK